MGEVPLNALVILDRAADLQFRAALGTGANRVCRAGQGEDLEYSHQ